MLGQLLRLVVLIGIMGLNGACNKPDTNLSSQSAVQAAPIDAIVAIGRLEPEGEVIKLSVPNAQDSRVNQILVKEGEHVRSGQVIAILQGIDRRQADVNDAKADVKLQQAQLKKTRQGDTKKAQILAEEAAITRLNAQLKTETQQRKAAIVSAQAALQNAKLTYQRRQALLAEGAIARADLELAQRELNTAQADLEERKGALEQTLTTLPAEIAQQRAKIAELREIRPVDLQIAAAQLEKAEIAVKQRQALLEDVRVRAPISGQILRINTRVGEQVNTSQGIMELARTDQMIVKAEIPENSIGKVRKRQRATIISEYGGFSGEIHGFVTQIGLQVGKPAAKDATVDSSPTTDSNARVILVKVLINSADNRKVSALTNMQVRVKLSINPPHKMSRKPVV